MEPPEPEDAFDQFHFALDGFQFVIEDFVLAIGFADFIDEVSDNVDVYHSQCH